MNRSSVFGCAASALALLGALGCASGAKQAPPPAPEKPVIVASPQAQDVAAGSPVVLKVEAQGTAPLKYQWLWNGFPILTSHEPTLTLPSAMVADDGSRFSVQVSNDLGQVLSGEALLKVAEAPRHPAAGDLRFKNVDAYPMGYAAADHTNLLTGIQYSARAAIGFPLQLGASGIPHPPGYESSLSYEVSVGLLAAGPSDRLTYYSVNRMDFLDGDVSALDVAGRVINTLDLWPENGIGVYALQAVGSEPSGDFQRISWSGDPADLPAAIAAEGAAGRVVTAVSWNQAQAIFFSYAWTKDPNTRYETQVRTAPSSTLEAAAAQLSKDGYIITAFGGSNAKGFILVGTRVQGDHAPRPFLASETPLLDRGYAPVVAAYLTDPVTKQGRRLFLFQM